MKFWLVVFALGGPQAFAAAADNASNPACVSEVVLTRYPHNPRVQKLIRQPLNEGKPAPKETPSVHAVRSALFASGLISKLSSATPAKWLEGEGFLNLMDCPIWRAKMQDPKNLPLGSIVIYKDGRAELKTAKGFWSDHPRAKMLYLKEIRGIYIKP